jgi:hypothetical protein
MACGTGGRTAGALTATFEAPPAQGLEPSAVGGTDACGLGEVAGA